MPMLRVTHENVHGFARGIIRAIEVTEATHGVGKIDVALALAIVLCGLCEELGIEEEDVLDEAVALARLFVDGDTPNGTQN